jgi:hypothetical protein
VSAAGTLRTAARAAELARALPGRAGLVAGFASLGLEIAALFADDGDEVDLIDLVRSRRAAMAPLVAEARRRRSKTPAGT